MHFTPAASLILLLLGGVPLFTISAILAWASWKKFHKFARVMLIIAWIAFFWSMIGIILFSRLTFQLPE